MFEVDQAVNKIRAEVDPEAELIFGAIKDQNLNGKMRVSIVATALDEDSVKTKSVVNNVHRIHTRNSGYSEKIQSNNNLPNMLDPGSIQGATALQLDREINENQNTLIASTSENQNILKKDEDIASGVSLENAAYFENNKDLNNANRDENLEETVIEEISVYEKKSDDLPEVENQDEVTPQLFSDEDNLETSSEGNNDEILKNEEEEDFEIPAFLRKQKF